MLTHLPTRNAWLKLNGLSPITKFRSFETHEEHAVFISKLENDLGLLHEKTAEFAKSLDWFPQSAVPYLLQALQHWLVARNPDIDLENIGTEMYLRSWRKKLNDGVRELKFRPVGFNLKTLA